MSITDTVYEIYGAFGRGDVPFILDRMADDVAWEHWDDNTAANVGLDHFRPRSGKAGVAEFFGEVAKQEMLDFQVRDVLTGARQVVVDVVIELLLPNGGHIRDEELHLWTFDGEGDDAKVVRLRHYIDTAKHLAAAGHGATTATAVPA